MSPAFTNMPENDERDLAIQEPGPVLAFNGVHLLAFLFFGTFMAWLASLVVGATIVAALVMSAYLWFSHPALRESLRETPAEA